MENMPKRKKFKIKILKIFILISITPLLIISLSNLYLVIETRKQNIAELQNLAIENASEKVKKILNQEIEWLNLVVSGSSSEQGNVIKKITEINPNNLIFFIKSVYESSGNIKKINFIDKDGSIIIQIDENNTINLKQYYQEETELVYTTNINPVNKIDDNAFSQPDFKTAISGQNYLGSLEYIDNKPIMRLASQIENQDREIIGVISAEIDLETIQTIISKIQLGGTGFVYLIDNNGNLIASSNEEFADTGDNLKPINLVNNVVLGNFHDGLDKDDEYVNSLGDKVIFAGQPMGMVNWFVVSEWPKNDAFSVIDNILKQAIIIIILSLIAVIVICLLIARQVVKPIEILKRGAEQISKGNLDHRINLKTKDEFETLSEEFNKMIKILKENKELKDEFVFIAAHELRTPVTAIKGYLSMILDKSFGKVPLKIEENLKIVNGSNERLVQLVQDLLQIARSDTGKMKINLTPLSISESVKATINELKSLTDEKGLKIKYIELADDKKIQADGYKLKEVLTNLIGNSIKYTLNKPHGIEKTIPRGKGGIEISHEIQDKYLITHIKDHGMGMSPENVKKLFTKFYRVQSDKTADIEGTGLGLFICKEIVERMNGKIWVKSELGKGSTFNFKLLLA